MAAPACAERSCFLVVIDPWLRLFLIPSYTAFNIEKKRIKRNIKYRADV